MAVDDDPLESLKRGHFLKAVRRFPTKCDADNVTKRGRWVSDDGECIECGFKRSNLPHLRLLFLMEALLLIHVARENCESVA